MRLPPPTPHPAIAFFTAAIIALMVMQCLGCAPWQIWRQYH